MRSTKSSLSAVFLVSLVAALAVSVAVSALMPTAAATPASAGTVPLPAVSVSPAWSVATLHAASTTPVHDSEPGLAVAGAVPNGMATASSIQILVSFSFSHRAQLSQYLQALSDPASPMYHEYLTAPQFDASFGGSPSVYGSAVLYFESFGVTELVKYADDATLTFDASPAQAAAIFHTPIDSFRAGAARFYAPLGAPTLPAPLARYVSNVVGLSDYSKLLLHTYSTLAAPHATLGGAGVQAGPSAGALRSTPCATNGGPFHCTNVSGLGYPTPFFFPTFCSSSGTGCTGQLTLGSEYQVAYNETNPTVPFSQTMFGKYGYPVGADIATILWTNPVENFTDPYCATLNPNAYAWDFYAPDVTSFLQYNLPQGQPMSHAYSVALNGPAAYARGDRGLSASCDSGVADLENTLDMDMESIMAPGSNVYQVFGQGPTSATVDQAFAAILNPSAADGPTFSPSVIHGLENVSVIANSWGDGVAANDTSWYADLEEAQARGITVVASTGDDGGDDTSSPAAQAYDTFGDVAVGGTTLTLNPVTLERSPLTVGSNPYTVCTGKQVCGSEITWFEPLGTVNGFGERLGTQGGIAKNFPETSWESSSPDVQSVFAHYKTKGLGEPALAADANNTPVTLTIEGEALNVTCMATAKCGGPPGFVTGFFTYVVGTSISDQVEGGIIASVDHTLYVRHLPWLGFPDPQLFALGQLQFTHGLSRQAFFDVTQYHNAGRPARVGWDLVTGWGTLDGASYIGLTLAEAAAPHAAAIPTSSASSMRMLAVARIYY